MRKLATLTCLLVLAACKQQGTQTVAQPKVAAVDPVQLTVIKSANGDAQIYVGDRLVGLAKEFRLPTAMAAATQQPSSATPVIGVAGRSDPVDPRSLAPGVSTSLAPELDFRHMTPQQMRDALSKETVEKRDPKEIFEEGSKDPPKEINPPPKPEPSPTPIPRNPPCTGACVTFHVIDPSSRGLATRDFLLRDQSLKQ